MLIPPLAFWSFTPPGDTTPPAFNSNSYDDATDTITADVTEDCTLFYIYSTITTKPSQDEVEAGQEAGGAEAALFGSFAVTEAANPNTQAINTSSLTGGATYSVFQMLEDAAGNRSAVTDPITDTKEATITYVNQAANDARFDFDNTGTYGVDYWFVAMSVKASSPEVTSGARVFSNGVGFDMFYNSASGSATCIVRNDSFNAIYQAVYPLDLSTKKHISFKYDGITGTPTFWVDGVVVAATSVSTPATTGSITGPRLMSIFDRGSGGRSMRAEEVSQLIVSTSNLDISDVWDSAASAPKALISSLPAVLIFGDNQTAAQWNDASNNLGSIGSYSFTRAGGAFTAVP